MGRCLCLLLALFALASCSTSTTVGTLYRAATPAAENKPRDILVVIDGTGNNPVSRTNAARLFEIVDSQGPLEPEKRELATFYSEGVGSRSDVIDRAFGPGLGESVRAAYLFLTRVDRGEAHQDRLVFAGFSRGAYAVRVLTGMISAGGVANLSHARFDETREEIVRGLWNAYKMPRLVKENDAGHNRRRAAAMRAVVERYDVGVAEAMRPRSVEALAIWDTVEALGMYDRREDPTEDLTLFNVRNCRVKHVFHALALDDNRAYSFTPIFADGPLMNGGCDKNQKAEVEEVWFAGAHADVGGAYADKQGLIEGHLPGVSLNWMLSRLASEEILIRKGTRVFEDVDGPIHSAKDHSPVWGPMYRNARNPLYYQRLADILEPPKVHISAFERLLVAKLLDRNFTQCGGGEKSQISNPVLCSWGPQSRWGFMAEMLALKGEEKWVPSEPCMTNTDWGWQLLPGQRCVRLICRDGTVATSYYCGDAARYVRERRLNPALIPVR